MSRPGTASGLSGGGSAAKAAQVFRSMDSDNNGALDFSEMLQALKELGALDGFQAAEVTSFLQKEIKEADVDHNGMVDFQEFQSYFQKLARMQQNEARFQKLRANRKNIPTGAERNSSLRNSFRNYCQHGKMHAIGSGRGATAALESLRMNARQFLRFCKDVGLLKAAGRFDQMTADVIFAQCKTSGERHIGFKGFLEAISMVAESSSSSFEEIAQLIAERQANMPDSEEISGKLTSRKQSLMQTARKPKTSEILEKTLRSSFRMQDFEDTTASAFSLGVDDSDAGMQALMSQARSEGASSAAKGWREEKRAMQLHIQELQGVIAQLQDGKDMEQKMTKKDDGSSLGVRSISGSLRSELEAIKSDMQADLRRQLDEMEKQWQASKGRNESLSKDVATLNRLHLQMVQLEDVVVRLSETQASFANGTGSSIESVPAADLEEAVHALEERALERQARLENALLQIATKVDALERTMKA